MKVGNRTEQLSIMPVSPESVLVKNRNPKKLKNRNPAQIRTINENNRLVRPPIKYPLLIQAFKKGLDTRPED